MTSQADFLQPPRPAVWLVNLFTSAEEAESILGDLLEEYFHLVSKSGVAFARNWYWRQTVKTIAHLVGGWIPCRSLVDHCRRSRRIFTAEVRLRVARAGNICSSSQISGFRTSFQRLCILCDEWDCDRTRHRVDVRWVYRRLAAKRREMVATMTLGLVLGALAGAAMLAWVARTGDASSLWMLPWYFADSVAIVIGGAIVRTRRSAAMLRRSNA
jgi:hypothetical protein